MQSCLIRLVIVHILHGVVKSFQNEGSCVACLVKLVKKSLCFVRQVDFVCQAFFGHLFRCFEPCDNYDAFKRIFLVTLICSIPPLSSCSV